MSSYLRAVQHIRYVSLTLPRAPLKLSLLHIAGALRDVRHEPWRFPFTHFQPHSDGGLVVSYSSLLIWARARPADNLECTQPWALNRFKFIPLIICYIITFITCSSFTKKINFRRNSRNICMPFLSTTKIYINKMNTRFFGFFLHKFSTFFLSRAKTL